MFETTTTDEEQLVEEVMSAIDEGNNERLCEALADLHPAVRLDVLYEQSVKYFHWHGILLYVAELHGLSEVISWTNPGAFRFNSNGNSDEKSIKPIYNNQIHSK